MPSDRKFHSEDPTVLFKDSPSNDGLDRVPGLPNPRAFPQLRDLTGDQQQRTQYNHLDSASDRTIAPF